MSVQCACARVFDVFYPDLSRKWVWPVADSSINNNLGKDFLYYHSSGQNMNLMEYVEGRYLTSSDIDLQAVALIPLCDPK